MSGFSFGLFNRRWEKIRFHSSIHNISLSLGRDWLMMRRSHTRNRFGKARSRQRFFKTGSGAIRIGERNCMLCLLRSRHNNGQLFITIVDRAEQCPAATTVIEIHPSGIELTAALPNDLQSVADVSRDEHGCACLRDRFAD